jgi:hypothetical protein
VTNVVKSSALVALDDEPPPRLIVELPLADPLSNGRVFIRYRTENLRIMPVFGEAALGISPRVGHVHVTIDGAPWHVIDSSGDEIVVVGLLPGEHHILIELADPTHRVIDHQLVRFRVPERIANSAQEYHIERKEKLCRP